EYIFASRLINCLEHGVCYRRLTPPVRVARLFGALVRARVVRPRYNRGHPFREGPVKKPVAEPGMEHDFAGDERRPVLGVVLPGRTPARRIVTCLADEEQVPARALSLVGHEAVDALG